MITTNQKQQISKTLYQYVEDKIMSAEEIVRRTKVPGNYLSAIKSGQTMMQKTEIKDKWYLLLAEFFGIPIQKEYWTFRQTPQVLRGFDTLEDARKEGVARILIGETGCGKSYVADIFQKKYTKDTFLITVSSLDTIKDLIDKILEKLNIQSANTTSKKIREIMNKLKLLKLEGGNPTLIFDECEFMKQPALCSMKELIDGLKGIAGVVLIGTNQLVSKIERLRIKNKDGIPQYYRRIKMGIRELPNIDRSFKPFLENIDDKGLIQFLKNTCDNYGELHDVLVPAMKEADRTGEPLTENFVRTILGMPK